MTRDTQKHLREIESAQCVSYDLSSSLLTFYNSFTSSLFAFQYHPVVCSTSAVPALWCAASTTVLRSRAKCGTSAGSATPSVYESKRTSAPLSGKPKPTRRSPGASPPTRRTWWPVGTTSSPSIRDPRTAWGPERTGSVARGFTKRTCSYVSTSTMGTMTRAVSAIQTIDVFFVFF